jgi:hypothetical protein
MKKLTYLFLLGTSFLPWQKTVAQDKTPEKTKTEERAKPKISVKVQIVVSEYDGEKKVSSMPYSFISIADEKMGGQYNTSLRTGVRIPIEIDGKDQKTTYFDMGSNIDCDIRSADDDRYLVHVFFERSTLYPGGSAQDEKMQAPRTNMQPLIRQFKSSVNMILKDGQTSESVVSTDPLNGHTLRMSVAINVMK